MAELLIYALDESALLTPGTLAERLKVFDVVDAENDGWHWSTEELTNPRFRIVRWSAVTVMDVREHLMQPYDPFDPAAIPSVPATTHPMPRANYFDAASSMLRNAYATFPAWWADALRTQPVFELAEPRTALDTLVVPRPIVPMEVA